MPGVLATPGTSPAHRPHAQSGGSAIASSYRPDRRGIGEMLRAPFMQADMLRRAENAKAFAVTIAPRDTGSFAAHMHASVRSHGGIRHDRAEGRLSNDDPGALSIETGTEDTPAHRTLQTSLDAMK